MRDQNLVCAALHAAVAGAATTWKHDQMAFAFMFSRHGARAPQAKLLDQVGGFVSKFPVSPEQLTPQGMRQRYLKGRYNRQRYTEQFQLLSPEYVSGELYIQSSHITRAMQSGYSELMGLYPPSVDEGRLPENLEADLGVASPPFNVRSGTVSLDSTEALPFGFTAVPMMNFEKDHIHNSLYSGCRAIHEAYARMKMDDRSFQAFMEITDSIREPVGYMLDLDQHITASANIVDLNVYCDVVTCMNFEGLELESSFSEATAHKIHLMQAIQIGNLFTEEMISLYISKLLFQPMQTMRYKVSHLLREIDSEATLDKLKLIAYDGHDSQAVPLLMWLNPSNLEFPQSTVYATQITFELLYSQECIDSIEASQDCFSVQALYNGKVLEFAGACEDAALCTYPEFLEYIESRQYTGPYQDAAEHGDFSLACELSTF